MVVPSLRDDRRRYPLDALPTADVGAVRVLPRRTTDHVGR
jgi:hypothetical protein